MTVLLRPKSNSGGLLLSFSLPIRLRRDFGEAGRLDGHSRRMMIRVPVMERDS